MTTDELKQKGIDAANAVSNIVNYSGGAGTNAFLEQMSRDHRTLQQSFTRLCLQWLEQVAERKGPQFTDARNETSQEIAEKIMNGFAENIAKEQNISVEEIKKNWDTYRPSKWLPHI